MLARVWFFFVFVFIGHLGHAQIANLPGAANDVLRTRKYAEFEGSPYLIEDWSPGTLVDKQGQVYKNIMLRYDSYKRNVEVSSTNGTLLVSAELYPNFSIQSVDKAGKLLTRNFVANINPEFPNLYAEELYIGTYSLYKQYATELIEETVTGYGTSSAKKVFQTKVSYLVKSPDGVKVVKLSKSSILENFEKQRNTLEEFFDKKKIKLKSESDLILVLLHLSAQAQGN